MRSLEALENINVLIIVLLSQKPSGTRLINRYDDFIYGGCLYQSFSTVSYQFL